MIGLSKTTTVVLAVVLFCLNASAKKPDPKLEAELAEISARGRNLAEYHSAVAHATDAVKALGGPLGIVHEILAQKKDHGWVVEFGEPNQQGDIFWVAYEATQLLGTDDYNAARIDPPRKETGYFSLASKAVETARRAFHPEDRPYEADVLPAESSQFYVYIFPAQITDGVYPYGRDVRYLISSDGATILESRQMHKTVLQSIPGQVPRGAKFAGGFHSHVLSDLPEDSDVLLVLTRKPSGSEAVGTKDHVFIVNPDGSIKVEK